MHEEAYIPAYLTVHLGVPESDAPNVQVNFPAYIKNVTSSEIHPTWPENAIRANIYAHISYALNRLYTQYYPNKGYRFDITNSTRYDQTYLHGRAIFANVSRLVDALFNEYVRKITLSEPHFTQYCNGTTVTCDGLSQWGTVALAESGYTPFQILTSYYGEDIEVVSNTSVRLPVPAYTGTTLRMGSTGNDVKTKQIQLNRISHSYPTIPKIFPVDGVFGKETDYAVRAFQNFFNLTADGIIGKATFYRISYVYCDIRHLSELEAERKALDDVSRQFELPLSLGNSGNDVRCLQYDLAVIGGFDKSIPSVTVNGLFDEDTQQAVLAFQESVALSPDGVVEEQTWQELSRAYQGMLPVLSILEEESVLYPGTILRVGVQSDHVKLLQQYLAYIAQTYPSIPVVPDTGVFGNQTQAAVQAFQREFGITPNGAVGAITWDSIAGMYADLRTGYHKRLGQYPGFELAEKTAEREE